MSLALFCFAETLLGLEFHLKYLISLRPNGTLVHCIHEAIRTCPWLPSLTHCFLPPKIIFVGLQHNETTQVDVEMESVLCQQKPAPLLWFTLCREGSLLTIVFLVICTKIGILEAGSLVQSEESRNFGTSDGSFCDALRFASKAASGLLGNGTPAACGLGLAVLFSLSLGYGRLAPSTCNCESCGIFASRRVRGWVTDVVAKGLSFVGHGPNMVWLFLPLLVKNFGTVCVRTIFIARTLIAVLVGIS